jgi:RNA polymerase-binding transcription factor DksA
VNTLSYVEAQRREMEGNRQWKDASTERRRRSLLNELSHWYLGAMEKVERAQIRITENRYGVCLACNRPVEAEWLDDCPETEFCATCHEVREKMA